MDNVTFRGWLLRRYYRPALTDPPTVAWVTESDVPTVPRIDGELVIEALWRGARPGMQYYGLFPSDADILDALHECERRWMHRPTIMVAQLEPGFEIYGVPIV